MLSHWIGLLLLFRLSFSDGLSVELTPNNIEEAINKGIWLIEYFTPHCDHCESFAPTWKKLTEDFETVSVERNLQFGTIDCISFGDLCAKHKVYSFPTLQIFEDGEFKDFYSGPEEYDEITTFVYENFILSESFDEKLSLVELNQNLVSHPAAGEEESIYKELPNSRGVSIKLDGKKLEEVIKSHEYWFIKFYSPSCPHCIALGPTWTRMASELRNQVNVAEVNCEALPSVCRQNGIPYYPLLRMYGRRSPVEYHGDRSLESLVNFAKSNARPILRATNTNTSPMDQYFINSNVALVYLYSDSSEIPESIKAVSEDFISKIPFYSSNDQQVFEKLNQAPLDLPVLLIVKDGTHKMYPSHEFKNTLENRESLSRWIEQEKYPLINRLDISNPEILEGSHKLVIHIHDEENKADQEKFREIASHWFQSSEGNKNKKGEYILFAEVERSVWKNFTRTKSGAINKDNSQMIIFDALKSNYYNTDKNNQLLSMGKPENIFNALEDLDSLTVISTGIDYEQMNNSLENDVSIFSLNWFFCAVVFTATGVAIQKYFTSYSSKLSRENVLLPSYQSIGSNSHKD